MASAYQLTIQDGPQTRLGRIALAGRVIDAVPLMPRGLRVLDDFVVSFVIAGRGWYRWADAQVTEFEAPTVMLVPPGRPHTYGTPQRQPWTEWFVVGNGPIWDTLLDCGIVPPRDGPRRPSPAARPEDLALVLGQAPRDAAAAEHQLWSLAAWLSTAQPAPIRDDTWAQAERLLLDDLGGPVDLPAVAQACGLGYDAFRHKFRLHFGRSPMSYRNDRRLEAAATLLRLTNLTTREIARRLGYTDEFHLSRRFREQHGTPPTDYRRRHQEASTTPAG